MCLIMANEDLSAAALGGKANQIKVRVGSERTEGPQHKTAKVDAVKSDHAYSKDKVKNSKLAKTVKDGSQALSRSAKRSMEGMKRSA